MGLRAWLDGVDCPVGRRRLLLAKEQAQSGSDGPSASTGLPNTPDYHSLLVAPTDTSQVLLGTHAGLYESRDGGRSWTKTALAGEDAMNLARSEGETVCTAGHNVFAKSTDGGATWTDVRPDGLPSLDLHGFAVDPNDPATLWAAVAGEGLYRSDDGGASFEAISSEVGGAVMALAVTEDGRILAGDMDRGLLASEDGAETWQVVAEAAVMGLAINPADPDTIVAARFPPVGRAQDPRAAGSQPLQLEQGAGPVAWSAKDPDTGYAVGFDRLLYRTTDRGRTWKAVAWEKRDAQGTSGSAGLRVRGSRRAARPPRQGDACAGDGHAPDLRHQGREEARGTRLRPSRHLATFRDLAREPPGSPYR